MLKNASAKLKKNVRKKGHEFELQRGREAQDARVKLKKKERVARERKF